ncbi:DUF4347 domain-containing protein [Microcoleus sp. Pol11C1]|uniref:DUF4347 domain-containing protein n=1 Tax=unclassified Microcoleus TaxID=2642155 RepID=UPI002FD5B300
MKTLVKINPHKNFFLPLVGCFSNKPREIVILDPTVPDSNHIATGIKRGTAIYILKSQPDAIEQITTLLAWHTSIEALHIITHGSPGSLYLGTTELNSSNIENYSQQLQQWRNRLTANASIILYGCNVAAGDTGRQFLTQLHQLTGANIAANPTTTGNSKLGGNWDIPQLIPPSPQKPKLALTETTLKTYSGVLVSVPSPIGYGPRDLSIGDFNGDGKPDLATANLNSSTASILLNTTTTGATTPTLAPKVDFPTGTGPWSVSIGDINGDGKPDLALVNGGSSTASILLNTTATGATTPTFATKVDFPTGTNPVSVSIGDFNGDGLSDLAVANHYGDMASILVNTTATGATTPSFAPKVDFPTGSFPRSVSIGDFNLDGKPDLAVANFFDDNASILLNTTTTGATTPTFATKVDFPTGSFPYSVSIGDINGDGKSDLATANLFSSTTSIVLNTTTTGATTPTFATKVDFPTGSFPSSVSIDDFNLDGKPDLAVANQGSTASILLNTTTTGATTPTLAPKVDFPTGSYPDSVSIGDINLDGKPDLAVADPFSPSPPILLNTIPKVTAVTATTADGSYGVGSTINITVTFDAAVTVTGTPQLQLETGTTDSFANYASGSGSTALTFNYVVQAGDTSGDLEYLATNALALNGGTIKETVATAFDAILTLPATASANSLGGSKAIVIDTVAPTITSVTSTTTDASYGTSGNINVTVNFSEAVTLAGGNMTVVLDTGGAVTLTPFTGTSAVGTYTPATGQNSIDLNSTGITLGGDATLKDAAGNNATLTIPAGQSLADSKAIIVETVVPTVALTSTSGTTTKAPFLVTATFSENVTGFSESGVNVTNGTVSSFAGSGSNYTFTVTPSADGNVTVDVPAAKATDTAGNNNTAAAQLVRTADITAPTVALTSTSATTTNAPFLVTATFSETVTGFSESGVNVSNGTVSGFAGSGSNYTFTVTPTADGNVTVDIPAAKATDTAGNNNTPATQLTRTADLTAPTASLGAISNITTAGGTSQILTVSFTDDSSGVDVSTLDNSDVFINWSGGAIPATLVSIDTNSNGTPRTATYSFIPPGGSWDTFDNDTYTVSLQASQVKDAVGNFAAVSSLGNFSVNVPTPTPTPSETPTPTTNNIPNDDCICDDIAYPNLSQPNTFENTILGESPLQIGTAKNDRFFGSNNGNIFDGKSGDDNLYGGDSSDILNGNKGNDFISGAKDDDILFGDEGNDIIVGEFGNDLSNGGKGNDSLNGSEGNDIIYGNKNDDFLDGGKDDDTLFGGKGNDIMLGSQGDDYLFGNQGSDTICSGEGNDLISGDEGADIVGGCEGNDTIYGGEDNDTLTGCQGDDILYGDLGNDSLIGGSGNDIFALKAGQGFDIIADFTIGQDLIGLTGGLSFGQLAITQNTQGTLIKNVLTGEELGVMMGVSANSITSANFRLI